MRIHLLAAVAVSIFSLPVLADSLSGPYVGASLGYGWASDNGAGYDHGATVPNGYTHNPKPEGVSGAVFAGYSWKLTDSLSLGPEVDYEKRSGSKTEEQLYFGTPDPECLGCYYVKSTITDTASLRARLNYSVNSKVAVFFTTGLAAARVKRNYIDLGFDEESHSTWHTGWTAGVGAECNLTNNLSARVEYRYSDYGTKTIDLQHVWDEYYKEKVKDQVIRLGLSYSF